MAQIEASELGTIRNKWALKPAKIQIQPVNFIGCSYSDQITCVWLVNHISAKLRHPDFKMFAVLRVQLNIPVCAQKGQFAVIRAQGLELDNFRVHTSFTLHG